VSDRVTIAAVQLRNRPDDTEGRREAIGALVERGARGGADLVLLPELSHSAYVPNARVWELAEPLDGSSLEHARALARRHRVHLGAGLALREGVSDNHRIETFERVRAAGVRLHVMPHAWPMPVGAGRLVSEADLDVPATRARDLCRAYAAHLGVPTVLVNTVGPMPQMDGLLGRLMSPERFALGGLTQISTPEGERFGPLGTGEDVLVAQVELGPRGDRSGLPRTYDGWLHPGVPLLRRVLMPADAWWGRRTYRRRRAA
jgi:predicted amidohydrolase